MIYSWGIDPGLHGAIALIAADDEGKTIAYWHHNLPYDEGLVMPHRLDELVNQQPRAFGPLIITIEQPLFAHARIRSAKSVYSALTNFGRLTLWVEELLGSWQPAHPSSWKHAMGLSSDKGKSFELAREIFGVDFDRKQFGNKLNREGIVEAMLIAHYGIRVYTEL